MADGVHKKDFVRIGAECDAIETHHMAWLSHLVTRVLAMAQALKNKTRTSGEVGSAFPILVAGFANHLAARRAKREVNPKGFDLRVNFAVRTLLEQVLRTETPMPPWTTWPDLKETIAGLVR